MNVHSDDRKKLEYIIAVSNDLSRLPTNLDQMEKCCLYIQTNLHRWDFDTRISATRVYTVLLESLTRSKQRAEMLANADDGTHCPTCNRFIKRYKRKLNSGMCRTLIWLYHYQRETGQRWVKVADVAPTYVLRTNEISRLAVWNLAKEKSISDDEDKRTSGLYRITNDGMDFVEGKLDVPSHVLLMSNKVERFSETTTNIRRALGSKFSYNELMGYDVE